MYIDWLNGGARIESFVIRLTLDGNQFLGLRGIMDRPARL